MSEQPLATAGRAGLLPRLLAIGFLVADAALNVVLAVQPYNTTVPSRQHYFDALTEMPNVLNFLLGALICAALLLPARTRDFAVGFGLGFCGLWVASSILLARWPKSGPGNNTTVEWCALGCQVLALPALACVLWIGLRGRGAGAATASVFHRRPQPRVTVLVLGLVAFAFWATSAFVAKMQISVPEQNGSPRTTTCCTFSALSVSAKLSLGATVLAGLVLVLLAASVASAAVAGGVFAGMFTAGIGGVALYVAAVGFPIEFQIGMQNRAIPSGVVLHASAYPGYSPRGGFWLLLGWLALTAVLAILSGLVYRSARDNLAAPA